jgi:hypothetical protein
MSRRPIECGVDAERVCDFSRPRRFAAFALLVGTILIIMRPLWAHDTQEPGASPPADQDLKRATTAVQKVTGRSIQTLRSEHFQAVGDASESFMKITLGDCERIAEGYFDHFRAKGFDVRYPDRRLTLIVFLDERPFQSVAKGASKSAKGLYQATDNWLVLFDFRNVTARNLSRGYQANMWTLAHEATHLLTFNTGLLNRQGDVPRAIGEGLATYSEARKLHGRSEPGGINSMRLDDLAYIQRRARWISVAQLITDEKSAFGPTADRELLGYAESWLLVYYLMTTPQRLPQFRAYLKSISKRTDAKHRLEDAESSFGSLDRLDRDVRQEGIRLQQRR